MVTFMITVVMEVVDGGHLGGGRRGGGRAAMTDGEGACGQTTPPTIPPLFQQLAVQPNALELWSS